MLFLPPAQVKPVQARPAIEVAVMSFCRDVATQMTSEDMEFKADPRRLELLRKQALQLRQACKKKLPQDAIAGPLLEAALGSLEGALGQEAQLPEPQGSFRYGKAAKVLAMRYRIHLRQLGAEDQGLLPDLEALALLHRIAGLRDFHWRDEALRIRVKRPDPTLERDLVAAVEDHYGPWLTAVELEPMLEFCSHLAQLWLSNRKEGEFNRKVLELGLKSNATRVWRLAARKGSESLREDISSLLRRLDATTLSVASVSNGQEAFVELGQALLKTPLEGQAKVLLKRVERGGVSPSLRRRIAHMLEEWESEASLLEEDLKGTSPGNSLPLLNSAVELLREHPHEGLLEEGTRTLKAAILKDVPELSPLLDQWMQLLRNLGRRDEAEELLRMRLARTDFKQADDEFLARWGLWPELEARLGPPRENEDFLCLLRRFRAARGMGREAEAQRWILAWTEALLLLEPEENFRFPGASDGLPFLQSHPEQLTKLAAHLGPRLFPDQMKLLQQEPWRILAALDPEAPASLLPEKLEQTLRWRMNRMSPGPGRARALKKLLEEAEGVLGISHPALAEVLLELAKEEETEGLPHLERALDLLEKEPEGHRARLVEAHAVLANARGLSGDRKGLEQNCRRMVELLEQMGEMGEVPKSAAEGSVLLLLHYWREQSFDELLAWSPRILAVIRHAAKEGAPMGSNPSELAATLASLERLARFQIQLRSAGLP